MISVGSGVCSCEFVIGLSFLVVYQGTEGRNGLPGASGLRGRPVGSSILPLLHDTMRLRGDHVLSGHSWDTLRASLVTEVQLENQAWEEEM